MSGPVDTVGGVHQRRLDLRGGLRPCDDDLIARRDGAHDRHEHHRHQRDRHDHLDEAEAAVAPRARVRPRTSSQSNTSSATVPPWPPSLSAQKIPRVRGTSTRLRQVCRRVRYTRAIYLTRDVTPEDFHTISLQSTRAETPNNATTTARHHRHQVTSRSPRRVNHRRATHAAPPRTSTHPSASATVPPWATVAIGTANHRG